MSDTTNRGIGKIGTEVFKRKFRWTLRAEFPGDLVTPAYFSKIVLDRTSWKPTGEVLEDDGEKVETDILHFTSTLYEANPEDSKVLYKILASVYNFADEKKKEDESDDDFQLRLYEKYAGTVFLKLYDGRGELVESIKFIKAWPESINFVCLDHSNSDNCDIEITWRFKEIWLKNHTVK